MIDKIAGLTPLALIVGTILLAALITVLRRHFVSRDESGTGDKSGKGITPPAELLSGLKPASDAHILAKIDEIAGDVKGIKSRLDDGSHKIASQDNRIAILERLEQGEPSRHELSRSLSDLASRMSGVEATTDGIQRQLTHHIRNVEQSQATMSAFLRDVIDRRG